MIDKTTGLAYLSKAGKDQLRAQFANIGVDVNQPFKDGELIRAGLNILPDEFLNALAKELGLIDIDVSGETNIDTPNAKIIPFPNSKKSGIN